jgi:acetyl-CoA carboxylase biotin carboxylase subunit
MRRALDLFIVEGIQSSVPLHQRILADPEFLAARIDTQFVQRFLERTKAQETELAATEPPASR